MQDAEHAQAPQDARPEEGSASTAARGGGGRVAGTALLVLITLALVAQLAGVFRGREVDGAARQEEYFGNGTPPFGLTLTEAVRLPSGETVVRFAREGAGREPSSATFIEYPSRSAVEGLFSGSGAPDVGRRVQEWQADPKEAWSAVVRRGPIEWGDWSTKWVVERAFHAGGGWHEEARIDLGTKARALVLFLHWPDEVPADEKHALALAEAVRLPHLP